MSFNQKRKYSFAKKSWQKEDSDPEENSLELEEEDDFELSDLASLLKELLDACRRLSTQISTQELMKPSMQ